MTKSAAVEPLLPVELGPGKVKFAQGMKAGRWVFATGVMAPISFGPGVRFSNQKLQIMQADFATLSFKPVN